LSGRGLCDELITRPEESYRLCCVVVCDLETSRMGAPHIYDISRLRVKCKSYSAMKVDLSAAVRILHLVSLWRPATIRAINFPEVELSLAVF